MHDVYEVLGLPPGAGQERIKSAFRELAKRFHPDVNVGDLAAEQRFKEINSAYQILSDPEARAVHEQRLRRERAGGRRRRWQTAATALATFLLTIGLASTAAFWTQDATISRPGAGEPARSSTTVGLIAQSGELSKSPAAALPAADDAHRSPGRMAGLPLPEAPLGAAGHQEMVRGDEPPRELGAPVEPTPRIVSNDGAPPPQANPAIADLSEAKVERPVAAEARLANWTAYRNARFGFSLNYPGEVFPVAEAAPADSPVRAFVSRDGRAMLQITAGPIAAGLTIPKYRRTVMEQRYGGATYDYSPQQSHWFVLSGTRGDAMFYERITFSCDGRSLHGWQLTYPVAERAFYDRVVEEMHRRYRHSNGPGSRCGDGKREPPALPNPLAGLATPQAGPKGGPAAQF